MVVTATELKPNLGHCLDLAQSEDILISKNGDAAAKLCNPYADRVRAMESLFGILPKGVTVDDARAIRADEKRKLS
ncbi:prevent-host-death protein [Gordonibacter sp. An230]|uniref:type II toxin-antitoxin system prevent-host-death family antitoxin n=1 Tax=Gordonibacter sp. An230 TaxID=1965592 RepID=UPI000B37EC90|nr:type II toxin-antitoxin system prevent-host-death family antitoxin [Gordonibacter sp. An230]OUO89718.1 prevent-host-death protein [Gordonibacter sp. An230]